MALRVAPSARKALAACEKAMTASAGAWRLRCNSPIELKILPSPGGSAESFFHSLMAASNWPRDAKSCALCNTLLRSIAKSDLPIDQTLTVSLCIVNELGLWMQGYSAEIRRPAHMKKSRPSHGTIQQSDNVRIRQSPASRRCKPEAPLRLVRPRTRHFRPL